LSWSSRRSCGSEASAAPHELTAGQVHATKIARSEIPDARAAPRTLPWTTRAVRARCSRSDRSSRGAPPSAACCRSGVNIRAVYTRWTEIMGSADWVQPPAATQLWSGETRYHRLHQDPYGGARVPDPGGRPAVRAGSRLHGRRVRAGRTAAEQAVPSRARPTHAGERRRLRRQQRPEQGPEAPPGWSGRRREPPPLRPAPHAPHPLPRRDVIARREGVSSPTRRLP